jgi:hypothetical protein
MSGGIILSSTKRSFTVKIAGLSLLFFMEKKVTCLPAGGQKKPPENDPDSYRDSPFSGWFPD